MNPALTFGVMLGWCLVLGVAGVLVRKSLCHREPSPWLGQCAECSPEAKRRRIQREFDRQIDEDWDA